MPKKYSRIKLKITGVRVEKLQDITQEDAIKEGVNSIEDYSILWDSIYDKKEIFQWKNNPFVFAYDFEVLKI